MTEEEEKARHAAGNAATDVAMAPKGGGVSNVHDLMNPGRPEGTQSDGPELMVFAGETDMDLGGVTAFSTPDSGGMTEPAITNWTLRGEKIRQLTIGGECACALNQRGKAVTWGPGGRSLGRPSSEDRPTEPLPLEGAPSEIHQVAAGGSFLLLVAGGKLYMTGSHRCDGVEFTLDSHGNVQEGKGHETPAIVLELEGDRVVEVYTSSSANYWVARMASGKVYSCGPAFAGQLCRRIVDPDTDEKFFAVGEIQSMDPVRKNNILKQALTPKPVPLRPDQTVVSFACGSSFAVASLRDGSGRETLHSAGANDSGQLGKDQIDVTCDDKNKPDQGVFQSELLPIESLREINFCKVAAGHSHVVALASNGGVYSWGNNDYGQTGLGISLLYTDKPTQVQFEGPCGSRRITEIVTGEWHSMVKTQLGKVYSWGKNEDYQTGHDTGGKSISTPRELELKVQGVEGPLTVIDMAAGLDVTLFQGRSPSMSAAAFEALDSAITAAAQSEAMDVDNDCADEDPLVREERLRIRLNELKDSILFEMASHGWTGVSQELFESSHEDLRKACLNRYRHLVLRRQADPEAPVQFEDDASWTEEDDLKLKGVVLSTFKSIFISKVVINNFSHGEKLTENTRRAFYKDCKRWMTVPTGAHGAFESSVGKVDKEGWQCCRCLQSQASRDNVGLTCEHCQQDSDWMCLYCNMSQTESMCEKCKRPRPQDSFPQPLPSNVSSSPSASTGVDVAGASSTAGPSSDSSGPADAPTELDSKASMQGGLPFTFEYRAPASTPSNQEGQPTTFGAPDASAPSSFGAGTPTTGSRSFTFGFTSAAAQTPQAVASGSLQHSTPAASGAGSMALASTPQRRRPADPDSISSRTRSKKRIREDSKSAEKPMLPSQRENLTIPTQATRGSSTSADATRPSKKLKTPSH